MKGIQVWRVAFFVSYVVFIVSQIAIIRVFDESIRDLYDQVGSLRSQVQLQWEVLGEPRTPPPQKAPPPRKASQ